MKAIKPLALTLLTTLLLSWPLLLNRQPILFNDTAPYLSAGRAVWAAVGRVFDAPARERPVAGTAGSMDATAPKTSAPKAAIGGRSPFYGAFIWAARWLGGPVGIAVIQAAWTAIAVLAALPRLGLGAPKRQLAALAGLTLASALPFFTAVLVPDIFGGLMILGMALVWAYGNALRPWELALWLVTIFAALVFHKSFLLVGVVLLAAVLLAARLPLRARLLRAVPLAAVLALAVAGSLSIDFAAARLAGQQITPTPFLLARTIGDGTAAKVLRDDCPGAGYATCRYVADLPLTENEFLWDNPRSTPWVMLPGDVRAAVSAEQRPIVIAAIRRYPLEQVWATASNGVRQLFYAHVWRFEPNRGIALSFGSDPDFAPDLAALRQGRLATERVSLRPVSYYWTGLYIGAAAFTLLALWRRRRWLPDIDPRIVTVIVVVLAGIAANAMVNGAIAGVIGRYAARLSWLPVLTAMALAAAMLAARRRPV